MTSDSLTQTGGTQRGRFSAILGGKFRRLGVALLLIVGLTALGCTQGSYPVDIFYEMHYQQSYKSHEPPRLSAPESSVAFFENNPSTSFDTGEHLFVVNCSMCHGLDAKGAGPVLVTLMSTYGYETAVTPDLTTMQEGTIEPLLSVNVRPFGEHTVMPAFGKLLSPEERKAISAYIHALPK